MRRPGFSLIELTMVLVIVAIVSAAVVLNVREPLRRTGMQACLDEIATFDRLTRTLAREHDRPLRLVVDLSEGRLRRTDEAGREEQGEALRLPSGHRIAELRLAGQTIDSGAATVSCSARGLTPTYAVRVEGPGGWRRWVLVAGLSGQTWEPDDGKPLADILEALGAGHHPG